MVELASAFLMRAKSVRGKAGEGIPNVSPSVDARSASRSPSDLLRVIRGRSNGSGETRATELPKPSAAVFAQVLLAANCTPARASLRDSLSLGGYALGFPPPAGVSPSPCAAHLPRHHFIVVEKRTSEKR